MSGFEGQPVAVDPGDLDLALQAAQEWERQLRDQGNSYSADRLQTALHRLRQELYDALGES